jgi:KUP system potassium uptake protein
LADVSDVAGGDAVEPSVAAEPSVATETPQAPSTATEAHHSADHDHPHGHGSGHGKAGMFSLALGALGVVYGDIGTSPLYALKESFHGLEVTPDRVTAYSYGIASLAFWALLIIISIKYLFFVMRADNKGEGGILALTSLVIPGRGTKVVGRMSLIIALGLFGTALLYGDGIITPAISVLSAIEGFNVATPAVESWVIPISVAILVGLFFVQRKGTGTVGKVFGPIMVVWFATIALLGIVQIADHPEVLKALNPIYVVDFFQAGGFKSFLALGGVFLVVTGGEALYADMGHFGRRPIQLAWFSYVLPALVLNYFGQAAFLTNAPEAFNEEGHLDENFRVFFEMAPDWSIWPLAILATFATIIASQALISGAFSLTAQAVQLDYLPRLAIRHTSDEHSGQIYVPLVNWALMIGCVGLVIGFRTSTNLAAAYGIAVTMTMAITTLIFAVVALKKWGWSKGKTMVIIAPLFAIDMAFLAAQIPKIPKGGWFALVVAIGLFVQMTTWRQGRQLVAERMHRGEVPAASVIAEASARGVHRVPGTAVYLFRDDGMAPPALLTNLKHNKVLHKRTLLVSVHTEDAPTVDDDHRVTITKINEIDPGCFCIAIHYGFMEDPDVPAALAMIKHPDYEFRPDKTTYFIGRETIQITALPGMAPWKEQLFEILNRGAASAARFFKLPPQQVFEVGAQIEL